jgi:hypothetical protein
MSTPEEPTPTPSEVFEQARQITEALLPLLLQMQIAPKVVFLALQMTIPVIATAGGISFEECMRTLAINIPLGYKALTPAPTPALHLAPSGQKE